MIRAEVQLFVDGQRKMCREIGVDEADKKALITLVNDMMPGPSEMLKKLQSVLEWQDSARGPKSTWENGIQILAPVAIAREGEKVAHTGYYCDVNEQWFDSAMRRIYDVEAWHSLLPIPLS